MRRNPDHAFFTDLMTFSALGGAVGALAWSLRASGVKGAKDGLPEMEPFEPAPPPSDPTAVTPISFIQPVVGQPVEPSDEVAKALIEAARKDLGVKETSMNWGPRIEQMLRNVGDVTPQEWCSAAVSTWIMGAFKALNSPSPIKGSDTPNLLVRQFQDIGNAQKLGWVSGDEIRLDNRVLQPGMVIFYQARSRRGSANHVGLVEQRLDDTFYGIIDGNSGPNEDMVARTKKRYDSPTILGAGYFRPIPKPPVII